MASSENQQQNPNPAPPFLSAGAHETSYYYAERNASTTLSHDEPYLTPYLGLRARLTQIWINRWTVLLLLVLIRTLFAIASVDDNIGTARKQALSACTSVESVGSAMASMPHYMAEGVNELSAQGVEKAVSGLMQMLILTLTGVEEMVVFIINLLTSTYVCLITLAVSGSLHVAISVAQDVGDFLNSTARDVGDDLGSAASGFQDTLNGFLNGINNIGDFLTGKDEKPPTIDLSSEIDKLNNLELPSGYDQGLQTLNGSIPTFAQVQNLTNTAIRFPFEEVKKLLNESLPKYTFNRSMFPVPDKEQLTFCSDDNGVNDFFDDLVTIEQLAKKIFLGVIIVLATLAMIPMAWKEYCSWNTMNERAHLIRDNAHDPLDAVYIVSRPYTAGAGLWLANKFKSTRRRALVRWSVAYATTVPALFVLSLAVAGLLGCLCQFILLRSLEKEVPVLENQVISFSDKVVDSLNNASTQWAIGTNKIINGTNVDINDDVFGWVNTTTGAVNNTLNVFVDEMTGALNDTFGGTVLYDPIMEVLNCLVLLKIQGIQKGLTWVSDNAKIDIPMLPNDTFSLGAAQKVAGSDTNILAARSDGAAADAITNAVDHIVRAFAASIRQEAIISTCILLVWVIIALSGIIRGFFLFYRGGSAGVYPGRNPTARSSLSEDTSYELSKVPAHEQANGTSQADNTGNLYNGQSYTLKPAPLPTFEVTSATSPNMPTNLGPADEKMGTVKGQNVDNAIRRPAHIRASSHGDYAITSLMSPPQANPFLSTNEIQDQNQNPFSDPGR